MKIIETTKITKVAMFTDIHFGKKSNSPLHNADCIDYIDWFCHQVAELGDISHIVFGGDWFDNRNTINVSTMDTALIAIEKLNNLNIPILFLIGNHDLYHRENRKIFSTRVFQNYNNIILVDDVSIVNNQFLLCPFLFLNEYADLKNYNNIKYWIGHFEFNGFVLSGSDRLMEDGSDHTLFSEPKYIFSGHFHKRQVQDNVIYIGNTFPMDFGDAYDEERGLCIFDVEADDVKFLNWEECPIYRRLKLSALLQTPDWSDLFSPKARVKCIVDTEISYTEAQDLRKIMNEQVKLREFILEEVTGSEFNDTSTEENMKDAFDFVNIDDAIINLIKTKVNSKNIDTNILIEIYEEH